MSCRIKDKTSVEVINEIRQGIFFDALPPNPTQEEIVKTSLQLRGIAKTQAIDNSQLKKGTYLDPSGVTERYVDVITGMILAMKRTSDDSSISFMQKKGKEAIRINNQPDNKIKALSGTKVHYVMDNLIRMETVGRTHVYLPIAVSKETKDNLAKSLGFQDSNNSNFQELVSLAKNIVDEVEETQKRIDINGKAAILPEQFLIDPTIDEAGTEDLVVIFSDSTNMIYDFKTITPNESYKDRGSFGVRMKESIEGSEWIPWYKMNDFRITIPKHISKLEKKLKSRNRGARILPIHIEHQAKPKDKRVEGDALTNNITLLKADYKKNDYLIPIPIVKEDTGIESLNQMLDKNLILKNNLEVKMEQLKEDGLNYDKIKERLKQVNKIINEIIIKKDINYFKEEMKKVAKSFNIQNLGKINDADAVTLERLIETKAHIESLIVIGKNTKYFLNQKGLDPNDLEVEMEEYESLTGRLVMALDKVTNIITNRLLTEQEQHDAKNVKKMGALERNFSSFDEIRHPIFEKAFQLYSNATNKTRVSLQKFEMQIKKLALGIEEWGSKNGYKGLEVYKLLIDPETNNLWNMYTKDLYTHIAKLQDKGDKKELSKFLKKKDNADEIWKKRRQYYEDTLEPAKFAIWEADNLPETYLTKEKWYIYYELNNENIPTTYYSKGFQTIYANKELLNYYTFWVDNMKKAREILGFGSDYQKIPNNFLPWIKADVLDQLFQGKLSAEGFLSSIRDVLYVAEDNDTFGQVVDKSIEDFATGEGIREVPKFFIEPLRNRKGEIDSTLKSFDLNKSMVVFMEMVYNYQHMSEIQVNVDAMKDLLAMEDFGEVVVDNNGNPVVNVAGRAKKLFGTASNLNELYKKMVDYHLYGVKIQEVQNKNVAQRFLGAKKFQQMKELGFAPVTYVANYAGIKANQYFNGAKGYFYKNEHWGKAEKLYGSMLVNSDDGKLVRGLVNFIEPFQGKRGHLKGRDVSSQGLTNKIDQDLLFGGFRVADENADITVMLSLMQNYGFDSNGNLTRIGNRGDIVPLLNHSKVDKDGNLTIKGILENDKVDFDKYTQFRNLVLGVSRTLKGGSNEQNQIAMQMSLIGNLMMSFKSWMPALVKERFEGIKYNKSLMTLTEGRYAELEQLIKGMDNKDQTIIQYYFGYVLPQIGKLAGEIATFGFYKYSLNETRARQIFEHYKAQNPGNKEIQNMTFEDFLDYKRGQLRALAAELRVIISFMLMLAFLGGDWDDDGKPDYQSTQAGRIAFRTLNRIRRELMSIINPTDWTYTLSRPFAIAGLAIDAQKLVDNSFDELRDYITGTDYKGTIIWKKDKNDQTPPLYYGYRWIPGHKVFTQLAEPFEQDKNKKY